MTKHTPGQWEVNGAFVRTPKGHPGGSYMTICRVNDVVIPDTAKGITITGPKTLRDANAALIAAAPDPLEACKSVLPWFNTMVPTPQVCAERNKLEAAIAKAEE